MLTDAQQMLSMIKRLHINLRQQIHLSLCDKGKKATGVGCIAFAPTNCKNKAMTREAYISLVANDKSDNMR